MRYVYGVVFFCLFLACSGLDIRVLNERDYYSESFLKELESIQIIYHDGDKQLALSKLNQIPDKEITKAEFAKKQNLKGVILFSLGKIDRAIESFDIAQASVEKDLFLANNVKLNLASCYYKKSRYEKVMGHVAEIDTSYLKKKEQLSYHKLSFIVNNKYEKHESVVKSLIFLMSDLESFEQVEQYKYKEVLVANFKKLNQSSRVYSLEKNYESGPIITAYLAKQEAMGRFYRGDHSGAEDIIDWLGKKYSNNAKVSKFVSDYRFRLENYSRINSHAIGLVVPLEGKLGKYGRKVISGVNTALADSKMRSNIKVYVKDNANNALLAKKQIQELVLKQNVAVIIGGLFPQLAKEEYLEAKKYGVFYISLSPVYLPRSEKGHLLMEIPGSVESQILKVTKPEVLEKIGKKVSILYPWSNVGQSYVDELWSLHGQQQIELKGIADYKKGISDYRGPVKKLLGLYHPRERAEEYKIWSEIKNINRRGVRIVNTLPPVADFDWVFIPALPKEALQIIPTFSFYDVKQMTFIGGPSWINKKIQRENRNFAGKVFVIGNDTAISGKEFKKKYLRRNGVKPHLLDTLSYEGGVVLSSIIGGEVFSERADLESKLLNSQKLSGMNFKWSLRGGLWIKEMDLLEVRPSGFNKIL